MKYIAFVSVSSLFILSFFSGCALDSATIDTRGVITHGSQIDASNTGVPSGHVLTDVNATILVTEEWIASSNGGSRIIQDKRFLSGANLVIAVDGFTVQYCSFFGKSALSYFPNSGSLPVGKNIGIYNCEFDGNNENLGGDIAIYGSFLTLKRVHVHNWPRAMWVGDGNVRVEECYMHDLTADGGDAHLENIYVAGGADQVYIRNKLVSNEIHINGDAKMMVSASLAIYNESFERGSPFPSFPNLDRIRVEDNYFESDGHYALYGGACAGKDAPFAKNMTVSGNIFGRLNQRWSGVGGASICFDPSQAGNVWERNTWGPKGPASLAGDPAEGTEIGPPGPG